MTRQIFDNGNKLIVLALLMLAGSIIYAAVVWLSPGSSLEPFEPITVSNVTINSRTEGFDGPTVSVGSHYNGTITICNNNTKAQTITFIIQLERLNGPMHFEDLDPVNFPMEPGCETFTGDSVVLPEAITPGRWRESSSAVVQQGNQKQTVSFVSEPFEVLP